MREIRTLRANWRGLETEPRSTLHGHEAGNGGHGQGPTYGSPRQPPTLPSLRGLVGSSAPASTGGGGPSQRDPAVKGEGDAGATALLSGSAKPPSRSWPEVCPAHHQQ